ncbi:uncharacterized protein F5Z01DRAFT_49079 [Emericellopsis atlantica]|uniref:Factor arrest protein 11 n=1 Tax=Emericellopsis atlantica TaxID=2614577 RepID=A0A9P8CQP6_9HYPO|nr:uncharacterized protein F5Z01DRAFT_49079 [Emericellopsis atlantica]KAG9255330.1 hypothetical protein F5Z01DRAFT_49079 [Emericellopsis atlantica]
MEEPWLDPGAERPAPTGPVPRDEELDASKPTGDIADTGEVVDVGPSTEQPEPEQGPVPAPPAPSRPGLQRNSLVAIEPMSLTPAPDPPSATNNNIAVDGVPTDSLSLMQLRRIVAEVNRAEPLAYDFEYTDFGPHAEELDEWFGYQFWQWVRLNSCQKAFEWHWDNENATSAAEVPAWDDADNEVRTRFIRAAIGGVQSNDAALRSASIGKLVYLVLGRWGDTAMPNATAEDTKSVASISQLRAIKAGVECLTSLDGLPVVWEALRNSFEVHWSGDQQGTSQESQDELMNLMTIMYFAIEEALHDPEDMAATHGKLLELNPSLVDFMLSATAKLRWDEAQSMPHMQIFLLFWKSILLVFGGGEELESVKEATSEADANGLDKETITASPLDYHVFRQEITSKYPAYVPPRPSIPLEAENTSLLPPLPNQTSRHSAGNGIVPAPPNIQNGGASILDQPVHIATPAPSPPPSPGVGKGGKKQNYQTNQNFPFMYPPLDATSNSAGGKGLAGINEALVSRRWEGSDIPASILEAGELFSSRVRMTRATRQLWEERELFQKYDRGWDPAPAGDADDDNDDIEDLDLDELTVEEREILNEIKMEDKKQEQPPLPMDSGPDFGPRPERLSERDKQRLCAVESFYRDALPHLQSLVIVLLRPILNNVTAIVSQQSPAGGPPGAGPPRGPQQGINGAVNGPRPQEAQAQGAHHSPPESPEMSPEELDAARTREITTKAMTGILLLLLKWLRASHVLSYEYLSQLLLDSNYVPLVLKLFAHQDIQQVVDSKTDRAENSFFHFCNLRSRLKDKLEGEEIDEEEDEQHEAEAPPADVESEDDAAPPPIRRRRHPTEADGPATANNELDDAQRSAQEPEDDEGSTRPEVDELGYPVTNIPEEPITDFSRRNFFSLINYLRIMQKICKGKAHRNLLLVQYKSSTILRKSLKIPQPDLRLYTLKLFKNQVPYCGRKWRQGNMRVITAVYLHCRPELRDEWLAGSDVDAEVDSALPLEQALRSLTHWRNLRRYPEKIAPRIGRKLREEQGDFFGRELERLNVGWQMGDDGEMEAEGWP